MRFAFLFSGIAGFLLVAAVGLGSDRALEPVLRDASVACLVCGLVGRWFWSGLEKAFVETLVARRAAAEAEEAAAHAPAAPAPSSAPALASAARAPGAASRPASPASTAPAPAPAVARAR